MIQIFLWQNYPNHLQSSQVRYLSYISDFYWICAEDIPASRKSLGWSNVDAGEAKLIMSPSSDQIRKYIDDSRSDSIHMFGGVRGNEMVRKAFKYAIHKKRKIIIRGESHQDIGFMGKLRLVRGKWDAFREQKYVEYVLAFGHLGENWYIRCGYPKYKIFQYGYFTENPETLKLDNVDHSGHLRLLFIGQLIRRKGIDILISALSQVSTNNWYLRIVGIGDMESHLKKMVYRLGLEDQIEFMGMIPNKLISKELVNSDYLILPSRWDGWGAVINEALQHGTPVICSNKCGGEILLKDKYRGQVFKSGDSKSLARILDKRLSLGKISLAQRKNIINWSERINGKVAAQYLMDIIMGKDPVPLWTKD